MKKERSERSDDTMNAFWVSVKSVHYKELQILNIIFYLLNI